MAARRKRMITPTTVLLISLIIIVGGSEISLTANPTVIHPPITQHMWVRCSLNDVTSSTHRPTTTTNTPGTTSGGLVGRRRSLMSISQKSFQEFNDVITSQKRSATSASSASAPERLTHVTGITLSKDDVIIATVTAYYPAVVEPGVDLGDVHVTGDVSHTTGELGYLQLNWTFPGVDVAGHYVCDVSGVSENRHMVILNTSLDIQTDTVSMGDLLKEIKDMKIYQIAQQTTIKSQESKLNSQESKLNSQESKLSSQETELKSQQQVIDKLENTVATLTTNMATMTTDVADLRHVEQGMLDCHDSSTWTDGSVTIDQGTYHPLYYRTRYMTATFSTSYKSPPVVFLSTSYLVSRKQFNTDYGLKLVNVTRSGFTMLCGGDNDADDVVSHLEVDWVSIPV